jgi:hypothetical protein
VTGEDRGKRLAGGEDGRIGRAGSATGRREWAQGVLVLVVSATIVRRVMKILAWFRNGGGIEGRRALGAGEEGRSRRREARGEEEPSLGRVSSKPYGEKDMMRREIG